MAGIVVPVIPKTTFDFSNTDSATIGPIPIGVPIDITQYPGVGLVVRLHSANIDATSTFNVQLTDDGFLDGSAEAFPGGASVVGYQFITFGPSDVAPMARFFYARNQGQYVSASISVVRGVGTSPIIVSVSVDVYLQNGDETPMIVDNGVWRPANPIDPRSLYAAASSGSIPAIRGGGWTPQGSSPQETSNTSNASGAVASPHSDQQTAASTIFKQQNEGPGPISLTFRGYRDPWDVK